MSNRGDLYNQVREEIARWPQWKIDAYNEIFATSAHAEKVMPHAPTNADRIRGMSDEELARFLVRVTRCNKDFADAWLKSQADNKEEV